MREPWYAARRDEILAECYTDRFRGRSELDIRKRLATVLTIKERELGEARAGLRSLWSSMLNPCPVCGGLKEDGHEENCAVWLALSEGIGVGATPTYSGIASSDESSEERADTNTRVLAEARGVRMRARRLLRRTANSHPESQDA